MVSTIEFDQLVPRGFAGDPVQLWLFPGRISKQGNHHLTMNEYLTNTHYLPITYQSHTHCTYNHYVPITCPLHTHDMPIHQHKTVLQPLMFHHLVLQPPPPIVVLCRQLEVREPNTGSQ